MEVIGITETFRLSPFTGEFLDRALEREFRADGQARRVRTLRFVALAGAFFFLLAGVADWLGARQHPYFNTLITLRLLILVPAALVLYACRRPERDLQLDLATLLYALWLASTGCFFMTLRAQDLHYYLPSALLVVLVFLLVVPNRFVFAQASALYAAGLFLLVAWLRLDPTGEQLVQAGVLLSACLVLAGYALRIQQGMARREFARLRQLEITNRRLAEETQARQLTGQELQRRLHFEELLTRLSTRFINLGGDQVEPQIRNTLAELGEYSEADRSYIFQLDPSRKRFSCTHEWCGKNIKPILHVSQALSVQAFSWGMPQLLRGETLHIPRVPGLPTEAYAERQEFERHGTQSLVLIPLHHNRSVIGFIGLGSVQTERSWSEECMLLLRVVGHIVISALRTAA